MAWTEIVSMTTDGTDWFVVSVCAHLQMFSGVESAYESVFEALCDHGDCEPSYQTPEWAQRLGEPEVKE